VTGGGWIQQVHTKVSLTWAAGELGYKAHAHRIEGCPACKEVGDGSVRVYNHDGQKWKCFRCKRPRADVVDFVTWHLIGKDFRTGLTDAEKGLVRSWFAATGACDPPEDSPTAIFPPRTPVVPPTPSPAPLRPARDQLLHLWSRCKKVNEDLEVAAYLEFRGFDPEALARLNIARALPKGHPCPAWWPYQKGKTQDVYRLLTLLVEVDGEPATLQGRSILTLEMMRRRGLVRDKRDGNLEAKKNLWPKGASARRALFASPIGRELLWCEPPEGLSAVIVVEGQTDTLRTALVVAEAEECIAVLGAASGGFQALQDVAWPKGIPIYVATDVGDLDDTGESYAKAVAQAAGGDRVYRVDVRDVVPTAGDMDDALKDDGPTRLRQLLRAAAARGPMGLSDADPLAALEALQAAVTTAQTPEGDATKAVQELLSSPATMRGIVTAYRTRRGEVEASLVGLEATRGAAKAASTLRRVIKETARQEVKEESRAKRLRVVTGDEEARGPTVGDTIGELADSLPDGLQVPFGWQFSTRGLWDVTKAVQVSGAPVLLTERLTDLESGSTNVRVAWLRKGRWSDAIVPREEALDARGLQKLAGQGAPVHGGNTGAVARWLSEFEIHNDAVLPTNWTTERMGWLPRKMGFLLGTTHLKPSSRDVEDVHLRADAGDLQAAEGYNAHGTWEGWLNIVAQARPYPAVMLALYASLVPPILRALPNVDPFVIDFSGGAGGSGTTGGKTTSLRLSASFWGQPFEKAPGGAHETWDSTAVGAEQLAARAPGPVILDDHSNARREGDIERVIRMVVHGRGSRRGQRNGGTRQILYWRTVLISTGEQPITAIATNAGARARTLCLIGPPLGFGREAGGVAKRISAGLVQHYGHGAPRLIQWLLDTEDAAKQIQRRFMAALARWDEAAGGDAVAGRAADYISLLEVAAWLLHDVLGVPGNPSAALDRAWGAVCQASESADRSKQALQAIMDWSYQYQGSFWGRHDVDRVDQTPRRPSTGWLGSWEESNDWKAIGFLPQRLRQQLEDMGFRPEEVLAGWKDRGWLKLRQGKPGRTYPMTLERERPEHIVLLRAGVDEALGGAR